MPKVILRGHIIVSDADLVKVQSELATQIALTRAEAGCLVFKVRADAFNMNKFTVYEEFVNQDAFLQHQLRVKQSSWGQVTKDVQRHYQITNQ